MPSGPPTFQVKRRQSRQIRIEGLRAPVEKAAGILVAPTTPRSNCGSPRSLLEGMAGLMELPQPEELGLLPFTLEALGLGMPLRPQVALLVVGNLGADRDGERCGARGMGQG